VLTFEGLALAWIALAIVAAIVEVSIPHFGVVFVGVAAIVAAVAAAFGVGFSLQVGLFAVTLAVSLMALRPRLVKRLDAPGVPSRTQALIGREGVVTHDIEATVGAGRVNVGGEDWAARAAAPLRAGTRIKVIGSDGIILEVTPA
jgi:membrane protein implicated in regulation of membrane protease activity